MDILGILDFEGYLDFQHEMCVYIESDLRREIFSIFPLDFPLPLSSGNAVGGARAINLDLKVNWPVNKGKWIKRKMN